MNDVAMSRSFDIPSFPQTLQNSADFAFLRSPTKKAARQLPVSAQETIRNISDTTLDLIMRALECRTGQEFAIFRDKEFGNYLLGMRSLSYFAQIAITPDMLERLAAESFFELNAELLKRGDAINSSLRDQAIFTVWTFKKISRLTKQIAANLDNVPVEQKEEDAELASKFELNVLWARFHLDCLTMSLRTDKPIYPAVIEMITDGLRAAVNAYAYASQGAKLRIPACESTFKPIEWDEDEQELLDSSMADLEPEEQ